MRERSHRLCEKCSGEGYYVSACDAGRKACDICHGTGEQTPQGVVMHGPAYGVANEAVRDLTWGKSAGAVKESAADPRDGKTTERIDCSAEKSTGILPEADNAPGT